MPCGFGPDIEWVQENCDLVGRLGEWIGRVVRPLFVPYVAVRVPRLARQASKIEAEGASRLQQFRVAGEHGEDGTERGVCVCVCVSVCVRERKRE